MVSHCCKAASSCERHTGKALRAYQVVLEASRVSLPALSPLRWAAAAVTSSGPCYVAH